MRNNSSLGASVEFSNAAIVPNIFELTFDNAKTLRVSHVVWGMSLWFGEPELNWVLNSPETIKADIVEVATTKAAGSRAPVELLAACHTSNKQNIASKRRVGAQLVGAKIYLLGG